MTKMKLSVGAVALLLAVCGAWVWWATRSQELSERPQRSPSTVSLPQQSTIVQTTATVPVQVIVDTINKSAPLAQRIEGRQKVCAQLTEQIKKTIQKAVGGDVGKALGEVTKFVTEVVTVNQTREVCQDVDYHVNISRSGPVQVNSGPNYLQILVPVSADGQAGFSGDVAKALALDKKNFRGAMNVVATMSLDVGSDWCPIINGSADFSWTEKAQFEIVHKWWINIDGQVGPKLKEEIQKAISDLKTRITCDDLKKAVTPYWRPYVIPIALPGESKARANLTLNPIKIGFSGIQYEPDVLRFALGIEAATEISTSAVTRALTTTSLPTLDRISSTANKLSIFLPSRIGYDDAAGVAAQIIGNQVYEASTPVGQVKVRIHEVLIYPSANKLAVGLRFSASMGSRILDTNGWVYLLAEPYLDSVDQVFALRNISFTRNLDNELWSTLSAIFKDQIGKALEEKAKYDLKPNISEARAKLKHGLSDLATKEKIVLTIDDSFIGLRQVNLTNEGIEIIANFEGKADINVGAIPIK